MSKNRYKPELRKDSIITVALDLCEQGHFLTLTRAAIAERAGITGPAVQYHFKTMGQLRSDVMRAAVKQERLAVIAQGLTANDPHAVKADGNLQRRALGSVGK